MMFGGLLAGTAVCLADEERPRSDEAVPRKLVSAWQTRQDKVRTVVCSTVVESFYPRGFLTRQAASIAGMEAPPADAAVDPPSDLRVTEEPCFWVLDFGGNRVRKEYRLTKPHFYGGEGQELAPEYALHLWNGGKYRMFRPRDTYSERSRATGALTPDVVLYEGASHQFLLWFSDLPLLWQAGGISGEYPRPATMNNLAKPEKFLFRGEAAWAGKECVVLTAQEQDSTTTVREFWVGREPPHPIYCCRARDGDVASWQIEVEYRQQGEHTVPASWTYTEYASSADPSLFFRKTFRVQELQINAPVTAEQFEKKLEPAMVVFHVEKNSPFQVRPDGSLGPYAPHSAETLQGSRRVWFLVAGILVPVIILVLARRSLRQSRAPSAAEGLPADGAGVPREGAST
jgi:hypothetical protein